MRQNLEAVLDLPRHDRPHDAEARYGFALEQFRLDPESNLPAGALPRHQLQWLEIAMVLASGPDIILLDSLQPDYYGGNMDVPDVAPGAVVYFPVHHDGAYLFLGDCHGAQGDGELCGVAVEMPATVTVQIDLIKNWSIAWPRLETEALIMALGSARPMEDAARIAYREVVRWMVDDYHFDVYEAYFLLTQAGRVRLGNMVDPKYTLGASILKRYLPAPR